MSLEKRIAEDLKTAMKAKDDAGKRGLRAIKQAILLAKTDGSNKDIDETAEIKMLQKLAKQRRESIEIFEKEGRDELAQKEKEELEVIERYLPEQMSEEDLEKELKAIIADTGASSMQDMGKVMGIASQKLAGRADGKTISTKVRQLLNS